MLSFGVFPTIALLGSFLASPATASPVVASPVTPYKCVTYSKGILRTAELVDSHGEFTGKLCILFSIRICPHQSEYRSTQAVRVQLSWRAVFLPCHATRPH